MGRFEPVTLRGSSLSRRKPEGLRSRRQLYLKQLTLKPPSAAGANVSLMALTGSAPAVGHRQQPLQCCRTEPHDEGKWWAEAACRRLTVTGGPGHIGGPDSPGFEERLLTAGA